MLLAVVVAAAILTGALVVGDSVRHSLKMMVTARLGSTHLALATQNRFFRAELANELASELNTAIAPVLQLRGLISDGSGIRRVNRVEVLGVDERFFNIGDGGNPFGNGSSDEVVLSEPLAERLNITPGDEIVLRIEKPGLMSRDMALTPDSDLTIAFRLKVKAVAGQSQFGRFNLQANQVAPFNVFVPLQWLQEKLDCGGQCNLLLAAGDEKNSIATERERANKAIEKCWRLADAGLELRELTDQGVLEIRSRRIFIDESVSKAAIDAADGAVGVLTYFVNELRLADKTTPYSMVAAMEPSTDANGLIPADMKDNEILINEWLAEDLGASVGDEVEISYFILKSMRKLEQKKTSFRVRKILPLEGLAEDPELMPDFPGLADVENCRDWEPGIIIDLNKIRRRDEDYWQQYRGTPKAFVTLKAGQAIWANRYGNLTAVRYPASKVDKEDIPEKLLSGVTPASVGLFFQPVREHGMKAGDGTTDFGQLFLGFSMFLIMAALVLMGLIFVFGVENRSEQVGMMLAIGLSPKLIMKMLFIEGGALAFIGAVAGTVVGLLYTKTMIYGLATVWRVAVTGSEIYFYARPTTLLLGVSATIAISLIGIWLTLRKQVSRPARELLSGNLKWQFLVAGTISKGKAGLWVASVSVIAAILLLTLLGGGGSSSVSIAFFAAGALLLIAGLGLAAALLKMVAGSWSRPMVSLAGLGLRNSTRRRGRSLVVVGLLACGIFLVIAVGANRHNPLADAQKRNSGTGGFALYGESAIGILHDLNSKAGRQSMALDNGGLEGVKVVQLRVHDGDDASCFNLNRAQKPRLLGVLPEQLQMRGAFRFIDVIKGGGNEDAWALLNRYLGEDVVPAVGDYPTIIWALGKSVGDELEYTDEKGQSFCLRIIGMIDSSILQGSLLIAENEFVKHFPSEDGYRMFFIDVPGNKVDRVVERLSDRLQDFGLELIPAKQRLAQFNAVENTYLSIFQLLGGLGLILGSIGFGLVVLRNMLERRGELAMLQAVGLDKKSLKKMVFYEHSGLVLCGLVCGVVAALIAVAPALGTPGADVPYNALALTVLAIGISGLVWIWVATVSALGGKLLEALRNE